MKNPKGKGIRFEREVRNKLRAINWFCVRQAASAFPDLVAVRPLIRVPLFIECKCGKYISKAERKKLTDLEMFGDAAIAYPIKEGRKKIIMITYLNGDELIRL